MIILSGFVTLTLFLLLITIGNKLANNVLISTSLALAALALVAGIVEIKKTAGKIILALSILALAYSVIGWFASAIIN